MKLSDYVQFDACGLAEGLRNGDFSPSEVRACAAEAVRSVDGDLNACLELFEDRVEHGDREADPTGPWGGVPFMLKDAGAAEAGRLQEKGSRLMQGWRSKVSSNYTLMAKTGGLVNIGRTATPEGALAGTTESRLHGQTRNPYDLNCSTSGSSGGAAALVAARALPIAHGNDGAGSIRMPASVCGLVGLKPSRGRVSVGPLVDEIALGAVSEFFLTRTVRDVAVGLDVLSKPWPGEPFLLARRGQSWLDELGESVSGLRVGFTTINWRTGEPVAGEVQRAVMETLAALEAAGCHVEPSEPDFDKEAAYRLNGGCFDILTLSYARYAAAKGIAFDDEVAEPVMLSAYERIRKMTAEDLFWMTQGLNPIRRDIGRFFAHFDLLVTPSTPTTRVPLGTLDGASFSDVESFREANERLQFAFTCPFNLTGQPAISVPTGWGDDGFPIGVQLVARPGEEHLLLRAAAQLEAAIPWVNRAPPIQGGRLR